MILYEAEMQLKKTKAPLFLRISIKSIQHLKCWRSFEIMNGVKNCVKRRLQITFCNLLLRYVKAKWNVFTEIVLRLFCALWSKKNLLNKKYIYYLKFTYSIIQKIESNKPDYAQVYFDCAADGILKVRYFWGKNIYTYKFWIKHNSKLCI